MAGDIKILNIGNERPHRDMINMSIAEVIALRGTCQRGRVGCVIVRDGRIISTGYNGSITQGKHCNELGCDLMSKCTHAMHAEANAILYAARIGISLQGASLYCTVAPCYDCAKMILQAGIHQVFYQGNYRNNDGIDLLFKKLQIEQIKDAK